MVTKMDFTLARDHLKSFKRLERPEAVDALYLEGRIDREIYLRLCFSFFATTEGPEQFDTCT